MFFNACVPKRQRQDSLPDEVVIHGTWLRRRFPSKESFLTPEEPSESAQHEHTVTIRRGDDEPVKQGRRRRKKDHLSVADLIFPPSKSHLCERTAAASTTSNQLFECDISRVDSEVSGDFSDDDSTLVAQPMSTLQNSKKAPLDVNEYMAKREMTPLQERMNAVTMIPMILLPMLYILSGEWLDASFLEEAANKLDYGEATDLLSENQCVSSEWFPNVHALPPLPVLVFTLGFLCHTPFSFLYHWSYAHRLPRGFARTDHWSRRMDHAMIHFMSICISYGMSGRLDFALINLIFNLDSIYKQFEKEVRPRRNQTRVVIAGIAQILPIVFQDPIVFLRICIAKVFAFWLFITYPVGGWSHSLFHLVMALIPPMEVMIAFGLPVSQPQLQLAAKCAIMAKSSL